MVLHCVIWCIIHVCLILTDVLFCQVGTGHLANQIPTGEEISEAVDRLYTQNEKDHELYPPPYPHSILRGGNNSTRSSMKSLQQKIMMKEEEHDDSRKDSLISLISGSRSK